MVKETIKEKSKTTKNNKHQKREWGQESIKKTQKTKINAEILKHTKMWAIKRKEN